MGERRLRRKSSKVSIPLPLQSREGLLQSGTMAPLVGLIMGSRSDWETMRHAAETLEALGIPYEVRVVSAHRTPDLMAEYAKTAEERGSWSSSPGPGGRPTSPG